LDNLVDIESIKLSADLQLNRFHHFKKQTKQIWSYKTGYCENCIKCFVVVFFIWSALMLFASVGVSL